MHHNVIRRIQALAFKLIGNHRHRPVVLITNYSTPAMFAGKLPTFIIERVAIAISRWIAEHCRAAIVFNPTQLHIGRNVTPNQVATHAIPSHTFSPGSARVQALHAGIANHVFAKAIVQRNNVRFGILDGHLTSPIPWSWNRRNSCRSLPRCNGCRRPANRRAKKGPSITEIGLVSNGDKHGVSTSPRPN